VRMAQSRWVGVLAAIALVGVSTIGLRLSDPEEQKFEVINGVVGEPAKVNNGEVTVTELRVGTILKQFGRIQDSTDGMFMVIRVIGAATGPRPLELNAARLLSGDLRYEGYQSSSGVHAEPGFETTVDVVFEVAPAHIDDLTLELGSNEVLRGYQQRVRIKLGITPANAEQWRATAGGLIEPMTDTTRAIP
jgi:hypothetical protein